MSEVKKLSYAEAGVNIDEGNKAVKEMKKYVEKTWTPNVLNNLTAFAGMVSLPAGYEEPVLLAGTDGVGTKLKVAFMMDEHDTVGQDLVAMCVNDILVHGAKPLFFLDYIGSCDIKAEKIADIVKGVAEGCSLAGCALIGGETAELPGFYVPGEYDLAGFAVGIADKKKIIDGSTITPGDVILALPSTGLHSNGFSLARKAVFEAGGYTVNDKPAILGGETVGQAMLRPTKIYASCVDALTKAVNVKGLAHITGGGLVENVPRILPETVDAVFDKTAIPRPAIFDLVRECGNVDEAEMYRVFNMGCGMAVFVAPEEADKAIEALSAIGEKAVRVGVVEAGTGIVRF